MLIKQIILHKYNRLALTNLSTFTIYPNKTITILIGTGGTGKSSILKEMSPIPADLKQYDTDGYKEILLEHKDISYRLISNKNTNKHQFIQDGTNLNTGGTRKQQLMLVEQHLHYTPHLHSLLLGETTFTTMSVTERKRWFMLVSNIDYTYPLQLFNRIKERHRDIVANLKLINSKLTTEKSVLLSTKKQTILSSNLSHLTHYLDHLIESKRNSISTVKSPINIVEINSNLERELNRLQYNFTLENLPIRLEKLDVESSILKDKTTTLKAKISKISTLEKVEYHNNLSSIHIQITALESDIANIQSSMYINIPLNQTESTLKAIISVYPILTQYLEELNAYRSISHIDRKEYNRRYAIVESMDIEYKKLSKTRDNLVHLDQEYTRRKEDTITCNKCQNEMYIMYNVDQHKQTKLELKTCIKEIEDIEVKVVKHREILSLCNSRLLVLDKINKLKTNVTISPTIDYLFTVHNVNDYVGNITDTLSSIIEDIRVWHTINHKLDKISRLKHDVSIVESSLDIKLADKDTLLQELTETYSRLRQIQTTIDSYAIELSRLVRINLLADTAKKFLREVKKRHRIELNDLRNTYINSLIRLVKTEIAKTESRLTDNRYTDTNITNLENEVSTLITKEIATKTLLTHLSPTEGLIAKSLNSTLNKFIANINHFVNLTWSYPINIQPCDIDSHGLNYRFPVAINNHKELVADVSKCSSSQQEIINLGFKLTVMEYLNVSDYPIYLDEFARSFDIDHLELAYNLIDKLVNEDIFKQILMVSHFSNVYNRFPYATLLTLSKDMSVSHTKDCSYA